MSFETEAGNPLIKPRYILELTMGVCSLIYGLAPCEAGRIFSGTVPVVSTNPFIIFLSVDASPVDNAYRYMIIDIVAGTGVGQQRTIEIYDGGAKVCGIVGSWDTLPDLTSDFNIIDLPEACFNTRSTCQDPDNYTATTRVEKYCLNDRQLPVTGETIRPLMKKPPLFNPAIIDPRNNILANSLVTVTFLDEADDDIGVDPYRTWRRLDGQESQSTYWRKWSARNIFYKNSQAVIKRGFKGMAEVDYSPSGYTIDSFKSVNGDPVMKLKDPLKVLDTTDLPAATDATVVGAISINTATIPITDASEYKDPAVTGWDEAVLIEENVIRYFGISGNNLTDCIWGTFGTTKTGLSGGEKVQQCFAAVNRPVADVQEEAFNRGGVPDSIINTAGWATEADLWLQQAIMTGVVIKPRPAVKTVQELMWEGMHSVYWDERSGKVELVALAPPLPGDAIESLNDNDIIGLPDFADLIDSHITRVFLHYDKKSPIEDEDEIFNYANNYLIINSDSESATQFDGATPENIFARWITSEVWAQALATRRLSRYLNGIPTVIADVTHKDYAVMELGDLIKLTTRVYTDARGAPLVDRIMQVVSVKQTAENSFKYGLQDPNHDAGGVFGGKYMVIAPAGQPDWDSASDSEKLYWYIGDAAKNEVGVFNEPGFYIP